MALRNIPLVMILLSATLGGCSQDRDSTGPMIDSLQAPAMLSSLPRVDNARDRHRAIVDQPPGLAFVINGYGRTDPPPITLEAYYGNPAGIEVVRRALDRRLGNATPSGSQCASTTASPGSAADDGPSVTCWRSAQSLFVAVTARGDKTAGDAAAAVDEAWQAITA